MSAEAETGAPGSGARHNVRTRETAIGAAASRDNNGAMTTSRLSSSDGTALVRWLLAGPVQRADGGVAGWVDARDRAAYVYPEIAGYYLQWLAWRATQGDGHDPLIRRAEATQRWLAQWASAPGPPVTRAHDVAGQPDWRNAAVFCFDLAMVLRGLAAATEQRLIRSDDALVDTVGRELDRLIGADGNFDACRVHARTDVPFPARWSTQRGAFLAKAAAGVDFAALRLPGMPASLRDAARATFDASLDALLATPHAETHPQLYALEGYLNWPAHPDFARRLPDASACFDALVARCDALGRMPESTLDAGPARLDIVAQAMRVALLLDHHGGTTRYRAFVHRLAATLRNAITPDGAVPFVHDAAALQRNAWATMFASQALVWMSCDVAAIASVARQPLVV